MFKVKMRVRRYKKNVFDPKLLRAGVEDLAMDYSRGVAQMYLETVADWSTDHGAHDASPIARREEGRTVINIYFRGKFAFIYALQDMGFMRKIAIIGGVGGSPLLGKHGNLATGRMLRTPRPVVARHFTDKIAAACRDGSAPFGSYQDFLRQGFGDLKEVGPWQEYG